MAHLEVVTHVIVNDDTEKKLTAERSNEIITISLNEKEIFCMDEENFLEWSKLVIKTFNLK